MQIAALVAHGHRQPFQLETLEIEPPREHEVLVRIVGVGLCHTDIAFRDLPTEVQFPVVLGHEGAGYVEVVGAQVTKVRPGDPVALTFQSCGDCPRCAESNFAYCENLSALNFTARRFDGSKALSKHGSPVSSHFFAQSSFATYALANERNVVKVPDDAPVELFGPLGCGVQTGAGAIMRSLACEDGSSVLIIGGGSVGLSAVMGAKVCGCATIILVEPHESRRALGIELGATHVIDPAAGNVAEAVRAILPKGVLYAFDTAGRPEMLEAAMNALGSHGTLGVVSAAGIDQRLPGNLFNLITYGLTVKGIIEGDSDPDTFIPELIELYRQGRFPFDRLIKTYRLDQINEAIEAQHNGECVKVVLLTEGVEANNA